MRMYVLSSINKRELLYILENLIHSILQTCTTCPIIWSKIMEYLSKSRSIAHVNSSILDITDLWDILISNFKLLYFVYKLILPINLFESTWHKTSKQHKWRHLSKNLETKRAKDESKAVFPLRSARTTGLDVRLCRSVLAFPLRKAQSWRSLQIALRKLNL